MSNFSTRKIYPKFNEDDYTGFNKAEYVYKNKLSQDIILTDLKSKKYFSLEEMVESMHMNKILFELFPKQSSQIKDYNLNLTKENIINRLPNLNRSSENIYFSDCFPNFCFSLEDYKKLLKLNKVNLINSLMENNLENIISFIEKEKKIDNDKFKCKSTLNYEELNKRIKNLYNGNSISYQTFYNLMKIYEYLDSKVNLYKKTKKENELIFHETEKFYKCIKKSEKEDIERGNYKINFLDN